MKRATARSLRVSAAAAAAIAAAFLAGSARACADFAAAPSTRWSLVTENGVSWLVTPCGDRFFSLGVNVLDGGNSEHAKVGKAYSGYSWEAFAPTLQDWAAETRRRLYSWGFNSAGGWALSPQVLELPTVVNLDLGRRARFHWFDPFAPETETRMNALARELVAPYRNTPYRIGCTDRSFGQSVVMLGDHAGPFAHDADPGAAGFHSRPLRGGEEPIP